MRRIIGACFLSLDGVVTGRGNVIAAYEPAGAVEPGSFATQEPGAAELERRRKIEEGSW